MPNIEIIPVTDIPEVKTGDHLATLIAQHASLKEGDVVVVTSKIVSKAEGRIEICDRENLQQREELIRRESRRILRQRDNLFITETHHGFICANAGIDWSNTEPSTAILLPTNPDSSAHKLRDRLRALTNTEIAVVISDTFGRTWRNGTVDVAIGTAGIKPIANLAGQIDTHGNTLQSTQICTADEIAAAASLAMGKTDAIPLAIVRGVKATSLGTGSVATDVLRNSQQDLFR